MPDWGERNCVKRLWRDNTLGRRFAGAVGLVGRLSACDDASDTDRRYLVAHSHGGSVVMYALRNQITLRKLSGVVCLSSPFLCYRLAGFHRDLLLFSAVLLGIVAAARGGALLWTYAVVYAFVSVGLLPTQNFGHTKASRDRLDAQGERVGLPRKEDLRNDSAPIPFLAVRPHRDEVTALFWFTQNAGRAFRALWQFVNTVGRWSLYLFVTVRVIEWIVEEFLPDADLTTLERAFTVRRAA